MAQSTDISHCNSARDDQSAPCRHGGRGPRRHAGGGHRLRSARRRVRAVEHSRSAAPGGRDRRRRRSTAARGRSTAGAVPMSAVTPTGASLAQGGSWNGPPPWSASKWTRSTPSRRRCASGRSSDLPLLVQLAEPSVGTGLENRCSPARAACSTWHRWRHPPSWRPACSAPPTPLNWAGYELAPSGQAQPWSRCPRPTTPSGPRRPPAPRRHHARSATRPWSCARPRPPRFTRGDRVAVLGTAEELQRMQISTTGPGAPGALSRPGPPASACRWDCVRRRATAPWPLWPAALFALIVVATIVLHYTFRPDNGHAHLGCSTPCISRWRPWQPWATATTTSPARARGSLCSPSASSVLTAWVCVLEQLSHSSQHSIACTAVGARSLGRRGGTSMVDRVHRHRPRRSRDQRGPSARGPKASRSSSLTRRRQPLPLTSPRPGSPVVPFADATQSQHHRMVNIADAKAVAVLTSGDLTKVEPACQLARVVGGTLG